jgi:hypothetical protein
MVLMENASDLRLGRDVDGNLTHVRDYLQERDVGPGLRLRDHGAHQFSIHYRRAELGGAVRPLEHRLDDERPEHHRHAELVHERRNSQLHVPDKRDT